MKYFSRNQAFHNDSEKAAEGATFDSPEELVDFTRNYFSSDFPNPERLDCPASGAWSAQAHSGKPPDDELRRHLFDCSECFREYRAAMVRQRIAVPSPAVSWRSGLKELFARQRTPAFAGAFSLLLLFLIGAHAWREYVATEPAPIAARNDDASANAAPDTSSRGGSTPAAPGNAAGVEPQAGQPAHAEPPAPINRRAPVAPRPRPTDQVPRELIAMNTVKADLEDYTALRGGSEAGGGAGAIRVSRARTRLLLTLPEGGSEGLYTISIVDVSGRALVAASARSADGKTVAATLNFQEVPAQKYRLRISRGGEIPSYYPILVEDKKAIPQVKRH